MQVIFSNKEDFLEKKQKFVSGGVNNLHVLSDFDRTLTKAFVNGKKIPSIISELRNGHYISADYATRSTKLAEIYAPIELDPKIPLDEKREKMNEWWTKHFKLLIEVGLKLEHIKDVVSKGRIQFREFSLDFFDMLNKNNIPLVIISSAGLGGESIRMVFEKENKMSSNIHIISNYLEFNEKGVCVGIREPIIHVLNKKEVSVKGLPVYEDLLKRKNVLLFGDGLGDVEMIEGFPYDNLIKIGFLDEMVEESLKDYKKAFDVVIIGDGDFSFINDLLKEIIEK